MGDPFFCPAPFVAVVFGFKINAAAIAIAFLAGDAVGYAPNFGSMPKIGMHIRDIVFAEAIHEAHGIGITTKDPGQLLRCICC